MENKFDNKLFGATIKAKMLHNTLSLRELAKETGVSASTLSRLINGKDPDMDSFAALIKWLDVDASMFLDSPRGGKMRENEKWAWLYMCLNELEIPEEMIKAIVTIIRLEKRKE